jgi:ankyrin repeat protein
VNVKDDYEWMDTAALRLHRNGHIEIARLLLQNEADVNAKDKDGRTPLHRTAWYGQIDILFHLLVENGADLEAQDNNGWRALHEAAWFGHLTFVQELISKYHVDINVRDNDGRTALFWAKDRNLTEVIAFLKANGGIE